MFLRFILGFFKICNASHSLYPAISIASNQATALSILFILISILLGIIAAVLLYKGGLTALQTSVVVTGVPFSIIVVFACRHFYKSLESELKD